MSVLRRTDFRGHFTSVHLKEKCTQRLDDAIDGIDGYASVFLLRFMMIKAIGDGIGFVSPITSAFYRVPVAALSSVVQKFLDVGCFSSGSTAVDSVGGRLIFIRPLSRSEAMCPGFLIVRGTRCFHAFHCYRLSGCFRYKVIRLWISDVAHAYRCCEKVSVPPSRLKCC